MGNYCDLLNTKPCFHSMTTQEGANGEIGQSIRLPNSFLRGKKGLVSLEIRHFSRYCHSTGTCRLNQVDSVDMGSLVQSSYLDIHIPKILIGTNAV